MSKVIYDIGMLDENLCSTLVNSIRGIVWEAEPLTFIFFFVSPHAERILGYPMQQWINEPDFWRTHTHPDDVAWCSDYCRETSLKGVDHEFEYRMIAADGRIVWLHDIVTVVRTDDGVVRLRGIMFDITERKKQQLALLEETARWQMMMERSPDGVAILDAASCAVRDVNPAFAEMLGYSRNEMPGMHPWDWDLRFTREEIEAMAVENAKGDIIFETRMRRKDGITRDVEVSATLAEFNGERHFFSFCRDITERKRAEVALRESEELYHTLCVSAPIGIFRTDGEGNNIYCSPGWEKITGMSASEGMGMGWVRGIHPDDLEEHKKAWNDAVAAGHIYSNEHRRLTPQGKRIWVRTLVTPLKSPDGKILGFTGTMEEITEHRQARQDILKNLKIEALGVLAGGIAHDFNNILTIILGNVSLARLQLHDPEKVSKQLEKTEKAIARAKDLSQQLLTFARGGEPVKKIIDLGCLLKEAAGFALHGSNVRGKFVLAEDLRPVEADEGQLSQVIQNLVLNAVQAMPEGGSVTISAENAISAQEGKRYVQISVADSGAGISEQHLQRIFDPYFTTKQQGSGLGLATCYSIIRRHGGRIRATSTLGKGSTFHISLPASEKDCLSEPYSRKAVSHGRGRVLVMDDDEDIRELTQELLKELGYTVESVENGSEAEDLYRKRKKEGTPFSAVILDLTIPGGVGGKEAIKKLLRIDKDIKAIVSSGYSTDPIMANYRDYGFSAVLVKPYRTEDLSKVLQELLT